MILWYLYSVSRKGALAGDGNATTERIQEAIHVLTPLAMGLCARFPGDIIACRVDAALQGKFLHADNPALIH